MIQGELNVTVVHGRLRVDRADPDVMIMKTLLDELAHDPHPDVSLTGDAFTIHATNGTFRYQLGHWAWDKWTRNPGRVAHLIQPAGGSVGGAAPTQEEMR